MGIKENKSGLPTLFQEVQVTCVGVTPTRPGQPERAEEPVQARAPPEHLNFLQPSGWAHSRVTQAGPLSAKASLGHLEGSEVTK